MMAARACVSVSFMVCDLRSHSALNNTRFRFACLIAAELACAAQGEALRKDDQYSKKEAQARFEAALRCARITGHNPLARAFCKLARSRDPTGINQIRYLPRRSASGPRAETHRLTESVRGAHHRLKIGLCARETAGLQTP